MSDTASAPASSTALAIETISVTLGDSFMMTGKSVFLFTAFVTSAAIWGSEPKAIPPHFTFGQEILTSKASTPSTDNAFAAMPYSSMFLPTILQITGTSYFFNSGRYLFLKTLVPGFSRPMQFSIPDDVSAIRTPSLPSQGVIAIPLQEIAPICDKSM